MTPYLPQGAELADCQWKLVPAAPTPEWIASVDMSRHGVPSHRSGCSCPECVIWAALHSAPAPPIANVPPQDEAVALTILEGLTFGSPVKAPGNSSKGRIAGGDQFAAIPPDGRVFVDYPAGGGAFWNINQLQPWSSYRDELGRAVRNAWVKWAKTQPNPKPSWLLPYDDLAEADKEADRQIAEALNAEFYRSPKADMIWDSVHRRWETVASVERRPSPGTATAGASYVDDGDDYPVVALAERIIDMVQSAGDRRAAVDRIIGAVAHLYPDRSASQSRVERLETGAREARRTAIDEAALVAKYGMDRAQRDYRTESPHSDAYRMAEEIYEAIQALGDRS